MFFGLNNTPVLMRRFTSASLKTVIPLFFLLPAVAGADTVKLDFSSQFNAKITRNSAGQDCNFDDPNRCFVSASVAANAGRSGKGLPDNGEFAATKDHPVLKLAPFNSSGNDAWKAKSTGSKTFTLTEGKYSSVHLVATAGGAGGNTKASFKIEMKYKDGTSETSRVYEVPDWYGSPQAPTYVVKGSMDRYDSKYVEVTSRDKPAIFGFGIATDSSKTLISISVQITQIPAVFALLGGAATTESFESVANPPGAPTGVSATALNKSASVSFTKPTSDGGAPITSYTVTASPGGASASGTRSPITLTGLANGTTYTAKVTASNVAGTGPAGSSSAFVPAGPPGAPTIASVEPEDESAIVSFTPPTSNGGATITSYTVTASPGGGQATGSGTPITLTGLTNGTPYTASVTATNRAGTGPGSASSSAFVPAPACEDIADWDAAKNTEGWLCRADGELYEYADFHVMTKATSNASCDNVRRAIDGSMFFCASSDGYFHALGNWGTTDNKDLSWLDGFEQFGLNFQNKKRNQIASPINRPFQNMAGDGGPAMETLDISNHSDLGTMFYGAKAFNRDISGWNTSHVISMNAMFYDAAAFNQPLNTWYIGNVANMDAMFDGARSFNLPLNTWDTSKVTNMQSMFRDARAFNQPLNTWNTSVVTDMVAMFSGAMAFNQPLDTWNTSNVAVMVDMFKDARAFNQPLGTWNTANVANMSSMFHGATDFNQDLSSWKPVAKEFKPWDFDTGATSWCGLGFDNQGRPYSWSPSEANNCQLILDVTTEPTDVVATDSTVLYAASFSNNSSTDISAATLTFTLPTGTTVNEDATTKGFITNGGDLQWTDLDVPKGSDGGEIVIGVDVPLSFSDDTLIANTTLAATGASADKDTVLNVSSDGEPVFAATLDAPTYALAESAFSYQLNLINTGNAYAKNATVTLTWDQGGPVPESSNGNCSGSPLSCSWLVSLAADDDGGWSTDLTVTVPKAAVFGDVIDARLSVTHAASSATGGASARTTIDARPELVLVLTSSPRRAVAPEGEVEMTMALKNVGTAPAENVVLILPTSTATFASASDSGAASGDNVVWPAIASLAESDTATILTATLTAGAADSVIQTQASVAGTTAGGAIVSDTSNAITLRAANEAAPVLTAAFDPENFSPGGALSLNFTIANEGSAELASGTLVVSLPKDTSVATVPTSTGASCTETACTIPLDALAAGGSATVSVSLTVDASSSLTRLVGAGALKPNTEGAFQFQAATAEADLQITSDTQGPYEISITPEAGSGCSLTSVSTQKDTDVPGFTLARDELLNFSISGCDPGTAVPVAITVQGDALPEGTLAIKADDSGVSGAQITGATITGNTLRYTLTDNGPLDLDPDDGELRDPVAVAISGGSGIYVPFIPVPIPYWVLGLLTGLMGWLGYRRLRLA